ncbi:unnamed protein product [Orchesella dallaii]|uniref:Uncharacterized protein n=1 Tax=Orchesella dallaii TaxID=48710 RepID=A0ABP1R6B7_9HEXA
MYNVLIWKKLITITQIDNYICSNGDDDKCIRTELSENFLVIGRPTSLKETRPELESQKVKFPGYYRVQELSEEYSLVM